MPRTATPGTADRGERAVVDALPARLHPDDIEAIALRVAAALTQETRPFLSAQQVADRYGMTREWVYLHKNELGAVPLGTGAKPRLRFPLDACDQYFRDKVEARRAKSQPRPRRRGVRRQDHSGATDPLIAPRRRIIPLP